MYQAFCLAKQCFSLNSRCPHSDWGWRRYKNRSHRSNMMLSCAENLLCMYLCMHLKQLRHFFSEPLRYPCSSCTNARRPVLRMIGCKHKKHMHTLGRQNEPRRLC
jgi:hypothetical protein